MAIYRMGNRPDTNMPEKWGREWKMAPGPKMAEKWPPKWKNGPRNGILAVFFAIFFLFPFQQPFFGRFGPGPMFHSLPHFSGIFVSGRFPIL